MARGVACGNRGSLQKERDGTGHLCLISIADFKPDPAQSRKVVNPEALAELRESIRAYGILPGDAQRRFCLPDGAACDFKVEIMGENRYWEPGLNGFPSECSPGERTMVIPCT
jgi:hypothetical protein